MQNKSFSVIYDNDMGNDIDDAFAQVMVARAHRLGKTKLVLSLSSNTNPWSVAANDALNRYYGVKDCPLAIYGGTVKYAYDTGDIDKTISGGKLIDGKLVSDGISALRKVLNEAEDNSIRIVATGFASNLAGLLCTKANHNGDGIKCSGIDLAKRKVQFVSVMACDFNILHTRIKPYGEFNVNGDVPAMKKLMDDWPTEIVVSDFLIGQLVPVIWERLENQLSSKNPLMLGYKQYYDHGKGDPMGDRPSWDQTSMLYALEPEADHFGLSDPGEVAILDDGVSIFKPCKNGRRRHLLLDDFHTPAKITDTLFMHYVE